MSEAEKSHLDIETPQFEGVPHVWVQWKGTNVCCDVRCACGESSHFDGEFMYYIRCPHCGQAYEVGSHVKLYLVDAATIQAHEDTIQTAFK
jgi:hypothetical protein